MKGGWAREVGTVYRVFRCDTKKVEWTEILHWTVGDDDDH
jgi:hypothetical protein